ncbi:MAG: pyridoxamine 5'-phosphate oxidase family protein [Ferruginibacter sp.]
MDSINQNQPEDNYEDLNGEAGVKKIKELVEKAGACFFCTGIYGSESFSTRPMAVQKVDEEGNLWFLSADDSRKNAEIEKDPTVQLLFQGSAYSDFLSIYGEATVTKDKAIIKELWQPIVKTWFTEGEDDPRITVIKITPQEGYYWDTKHSMAISFIKRLAGAAMGKTIDDSVEGKIKI